MTPFWWKRLKLNFILFFFFFFGDKESSLQRLTKTREAELKFQSEQNSLDVSKTKEMAAIDTDKFQNMVSSIGADTIQAIATAGPEMQVICVISYDKCNLSSLIQFLTTSTNFIQTR